MIENKEKNQPGLKRKKKSIKRQNYLEEDKMLRFTIKRLEKLFLVLNTDIFALLFMLILLN
jgi:hypothetical protein